MFGGRLAGQSSQNQSPSGTKARDLRPTASCKQQAAWQLGGKRSVGPLVVCAWFFWSVRSVVCPSELPYVRYTVVMPCETECLGVYSILVLDCIQPKEATRLGSSLQ